eukprot:3685569-Pyramimonas_sp.AAC.1
MMICDLTRIASPGELRLCYDGRWLANDPEARDEKPQQLPMHPSLPPPEPKAPDSPPPMPSSSGDGADSAKAASLEEHKKRFLSVRKYWESVRRKK